MESILIGPRMIRSEQQLVVEHHLLRRRRRRRPYSGGDVSDSCSSSSSIDEEEEEYEGVEPASSRRSSSPTTSSTPLQDMSSLLLQLPLKRGLSKHYNGKAQSFKCLSNVKSLEDLVKQENPFNKKLKICNTASCTRKEPSISGGGNSNFIGN